MCFRKARAASGVGSKKAAAGDEPWLGHALKRAPGVAKEVFEVMRDMIRKVWVRSAHLLCALSTPTAGGGWETSSFQLTLSASSRKIGTVCYETIKAFGARQWAGQQSVRLLPPSTVSAANLSEWISSELTPLRRPADGWHVTSRHRRCAGGQGGREVWQGAEAQGGEGREGTARAEAVRPCDAT